MKPYSIALLALLSTAATTWAADSFYLKDGDHVVFYGDSITDQRLYTVITETYVVTRYPNLNVAFTHSGVGGDKVSGGGGGPISERLQRDVIAYKPTVMTIMLGMNDGLYKPEKEETDRTYFDGMRHITDTVKSALPNVRFTLIEPSPYDDITRAPMFPGGYNEVLLSYSKWLANDAAQNSFTLADFNRPMTAMLRKANQFSPEEAQKILPDRVHPGFAGHLVMAEQLLESWGARPTVAAVSIRAGKEPKLLSSEHAAVSNLQGGDTISWTEQDDALPLPFNEWEPMWGSGPIALVLKSSDVTEKLNQEPLTVTGLHSGVYSIKIDGTTVGTFNDGELARGVNLAILKTPMSEQAKEVYDLTVSHCDVHNERWRTVQIPLAKYDLPQTQTTMAADDALEQAIIEKRRSAGQPKAHQFQIVAVN